MERGLRRVLLNLATNALKATQLASLSTTNLSAIDLTTFGQFTTTRACHDASLQGDGQARLAVTAVDCLAVCKRPCTVAFSGTDKWTYLIGDLDPESHVDEIVAAAKSFAASENGIVPWRERPASFRKGVIARVPPINHKEKQ